MILCFRLFTHFSPYCNRREKGDGGQKKDGGEWKEGRRKKKERVSEHEGDEEA